MLVKRTVSLVISKGKYKSNGHTFKGGHYVKMFSLPSKKGSTLTGKNLLLPKGTGEEQIISF